jgi:transcriptional regulator with XRE-family HTH domain
LAVTTGRCTWFTLDVPTIPSTAGNLRDLRVAAGLSQEDLAHVCGVSERTVRALETGSARRPHRDTVERLGRALKLDGREFTSFVQGWFLNARRPVSLGDLIALPQLSRPVVDQLMKQRDLVRDVSVADQFVIGTDGRVSSLESRISIQATGDGVDRYVFLRSCSPDFVDPERLNASGFDNCRPGQSQLVEALEAKMFELLFDTTLRPSEIYMFKYGLDYRTAYVSETGFARPETEIIRAVRAPGTMMSFQVKFAGPRLPVNVRRVEQPTIDGPEHAVGQLRLSPFHIAHLVIERPGAGAHGIRWDWPDD